MVERLTRGLDAEDWQVYRIDSPLDLADLMELVALDRPDLKDEPWRPVVPPRLGEAQTAVSIALAAGLLYGGFILNK